jgi:hypothetical protein
MEATSTRCLIGASTRGRRTSARPESTAATGVGREVAAATLPDAAHEGVSKTIAPSVGLGSGF